MTIPELADALNQRAPRHKIGQLQQIRQKLKDLDRLPNQNLFAGTTITDEWACHYGGRSELQFNIGLDPDPREVRHGVAFSLELSQTLPSIDILVPRIRRFNEFVRANASLLHDFTMWHYQDRKRSPDYPPQAIVPQLVTKRTFIFLGRRQLSSKLKIELILYRRS